MKHRPTPNKKSPAAPPTAALPPEEIGALVRDKVLDALGSRGIAVPPEFPARIERLASAIALWGPKTNLTAAPLDPDATAFHVLDSLAPILAAECPLKAEIAAAMAPRSRVLDLGSGAGFPALVLASIFDAHFTLAESRRKRATFLGVAAAGMGLRNVTILNANAAPTSFTPLFDLVTERALGPLADFLPLAAASLRTGGLAVAYSVETADAPGNLAAAAGFDPPARLHYSIPGHDDARRILFVWRKTRPPNGYQQIPG